MFHIYAGARVKHDDSQSVSSMWDKDYNDRYFDLLLKYKDQVMLEVGGHDHWEDIRVYKNKDGDIYRNMIIATGVGLDHYQLPGFNTFKVENQMVIDLIETSLDITTVYGLDEIPPFDQLKTYTVDFSKTFGF
jgi:hypothetical protein